MKYFDMLVHPYYALLTVLLITIYDGTAPDSSSLGQLLSISEAVSVVDNNLSLVAVRGSTL
jgi:hypothetical protein